MIDFSQILPFQQYDSENVSDTSAGNSQILEKLDPFGQWSFDACEQFDAKAITLSVLTGHWPWHISLNFKDWPVGQTTFLENGFLRQVSCLEMQQ